MQPVAFQTDAFAPDQRVGHRITFYDTPYLVLEGDGDRAASNGMRLDVREPVEGGAWTLHTALAAAATGAAASAWTSHSSSRAILTDGRCGNAIQYWAGGAPGWHGGTQRGRVAYRLRGYLRPAGNRAWFAKETTVPITFLLGGNGYFRIETASTVLVNQVFTEKDYLASTVPGDAGLLATAVVNLTTDAWVDFYYVQRDEDKWGGFVFKAFAGDLAQLTDPAARELAVRDAPVVGGGLLDDGQPVAQKQVRYTKSFKLEEEKKAATALDFEVPLINMARTDGSGWEWRRTSDATDPGLLRYHEGNLVAKQYDMKRQRLVRATLTIGSETWTKFTGSIVDFQGLSSGNARVLCSDGVHRMVQRHDKNYPDRIDYMTRNYRRRVGTTQPAYDTPALDNWPLEYGVACLALRADVDESRLRQPLRVARADGSTQPVIYGEPIRKFRARAMDPKSTHIRLERAVHYGNPGRVDPARPADDAYVFPPEPKREVWNRIRELTDKYGYDIRFDELGDLVLVAANNPTRAYVLTTEDATGTVTRHVHPAAYTGMYLEIADGGSVTKRVWGARLDVTVGRSPATGTVAYTVTRVSDSEEVASGTFATVAGQEEFFYDYRAASDGVNSTVGTVFSGDYDEYDVTLTATGMIRLNMLLAYHTDPERPLLPHALSTAKNAEAVEALDTLAEMRNFCIVVGRRKAAVTDSAKLDSTETNPEPEFVVAAAVDVASIADPTALHYIGQIRETIIYSDGIVDDDFAQYLARVFIFRYRNPKPGASGTHTMLPFVQLGDPVYCAETRYNTVEGTAPRWITKLSTQVTNGKYVTNFEADAWPPYPAYEPRIDIDIDRDFESRPVINVEVSYTGVGGDAHLNLTRDAVHISESSPVAAGGDLVTLTASVTTVGGEPVLSCAGAPWPPVPGTVFIKPTNVAPTVGTTINWPKALPRQKFAPGTSAEVDRTFTNLRSITSITASVDGPLGSRLWRGTLTQKSADNPVGFYYEMIGDARNRRLVIRRDTVENQRGNGIKKTTAEQFAHASVDVVWVQDSGGSTSAWITNTPYHRFFDVDYANARLNLVWQQADPTRSEYARNAAWTDFDITYRRLGPETSPYAEGSPFYDPYTSEIGHLVQVTGDFLVSGNWRVSIRSMYDPTIVAAWLTEATNESPDPEAHYEYFSAGTRKTFYTDMVDAIGEWNFEQSEEYANAAQGVFEQNQRPKIGKGFYVWNRERAGGELGPLALIDDTLAATGEPVWGAGCQGPFAGWFVLFEAQNDELAEATELAQLRGAPSVPPLPRVTSTMRVPNTSYQGLADAFQTNATGSTSEAVIWSHLGHPVQVALTVSDWDASVDFDETNAAHRDSTTQWISGAATDHAAYGYLNNVKPVRLEFAAVPRAGVLWSGNTLEQSFKVIPHVHLKFLLHDQIVLFDGVSYASSTVEQRQVVSRRLHNDTHTLTYPDATYRRASTLRSASNPTGYHFTFLPKRFVKNWTGAREEPLEFANTLQLEELPKWDGGRAVAGPRSRQNLGFAAYLWYVSAYVQDRSGRMLWTLNTDFYDASKLINNHPERSADRVPAAWPADLMRQHRRTIVTRQWTNEKVDRATSWVARETAKWELTGTFGAQLLKHRWRDHGLEASTIGGGAWPTLDEDTYSFNERSRNGNLGWTFVPSIFDRQLRNGDLGLWTFESDPTWAPCVTRDFWPYHLIPPMMDPVAVRNRNGDRNISLGGEARVAAIYASVDASAKDTADGKNNGNDPAAGDVWSSGVFDDTEATASKKRFWPGTKIVKDAEPVKTANGNVIAANMLDYTRQDDQVHWEELRGVYSRGPRPGEQPRRSTPSLPYYINTGRYGKLWTIDSYRNPATGLWLCEPFNPFSIHFRGEYLYESATLFPTDINGVERLAAFNAERARVFKQAEFANIRYDAGAWVGWKDDYDGTFSVLMSVDERRFMWDEDRQGNGISGTGMSVFESGKMPVALALSVPSDQEVFFHLALLNERRDASVGLSTPSGVGEAVTMAFDPAAVTTGIGQPVTVRVSLFDADEALVDNLSVTAIPADPSICTVETADRGLSLLLTPARAGATTVTVTAITQVGTVTETLAVTVTGALTPVTLDVVQSTVPVGGTTTATATAITGDSCLWTVEHPGIVRLFTIFTLSGETNVLTFIGKGTTTITVYSGGYLATATVTGV